MARSLRNADTTHGRSAAAALILGVAATLLDADASAAPQFLPSEATAPATTAPATTGSDTSTTPAPPLDSAAPAAEPGTPAPAGPAPAAVSPAPAATPPAAPAPRAAPASRAAETDRAALGKWNPDEGVPVDADDPEQAKRRSIRYHDGFYFRFSLGAGYFATGLEGGGMSFDVSGASVSIDLMLGGTPVPGFVVGGAYFFEQAPSPTVSSAGQSGTLDYNMNFGTLGAFIDAFPNPHQGWHFGGIAGLSFVSLSSSSGSVNATSRGFGGGGFLGYDGWISDQWALGGFARVMAASVSDSSGGAEETLSPTSFNVTLSVLNH